MKRTMYSFYRRYSFILLSGMLIFLFSGCKSEVFDTDISLVMYDQNSPVIQHGTAKIILALKDKGIIAERVNTLEDAKGKILIVVGIAQEPNEMARLLLDADVQLPEEAEALVIQFTRWNGKTALLVSGFDDRGVMYAALDVADRIGWAKNPDPPLSEVHNVSETPEVFERTLSKLVLNKSEFERYSYSEEYWDEYLDMLAKNRFNTFFLKFGYASAGYFAPIYPYLFDVEGFSEVRVVGITKEKMQRNLEMLKMIIRKTHERGMNFTLGLWTHISAGSGTSRTVINPTPGQVWGLTDVNLIEYTEAALKKFLSLDFEMDAIAFRVHIESAVTLPYQIPLMDKVYKVIKESGKNIRIDNHVKNFKDDLIDTALKSGLNIRLTSKYWGEQMGLPYHPTHVTLGNQLGRRAGYADLLTYPQRYKMPYRMMNWGTTRFLLWGDPQYARRFAESTHLYNGDGFEIAEPLAFKMARNRAESYDILKPDYQYYDWEYERYWHFFQVFGRMGYNLDTPSEVWKREFVKRSGPDAAPFVERGMHLASRVLPKIIAYNLPNISADSSWPEKQRWRDLPIYTNSEPSDTQQFLGIKEAVKFHLEGKESPKIWPQETSDWFAKLSQDILEAARQAEERIGGHESREFVSTMIDLKILAYLAGYHAERINAGLSYASFEFTQDLNALDEAIKFEKKAIETWKKIILVTEGVYADNIIMGQGGRSNLRGHWKDELVKLEIGLDKLQDQRENFQYDYQNVVAKFDLGIGTAQEGFLPVTVDSRYDPLSGGYGWIRISPSPSPSFRLIQGQKTSDQDYIRGPDPHEGGYNAFITDMPNGYYELTFTMFDSSIDPRDYGPMWIAANGKDETEKFTVPVGTKVEKTLRTSVNDNKLNLVINYYTQSLWLLNSIQVTRLGPEIAHVPVRKAVPSNDIRISATVSGPDPITQVRIRYGSQKQGYRTVSLKRSESGLYNGLIRASDVKNGLNYFIEAEDDAGRVVFFPYEGGLKPIHVRVTGDNQPPAVSHSPVTSIDIGKSLTLTAKVDDPSGLKWVRLRYRGVSQHQDFSTLPMLPTGEKGIYQAEIPASHIRQKWDLMYFIEVMDNSGNGKIYPDLERETPYIVVRLNRDIVK